MARPDGPRWSAVDPDELVAVDLSDDERRLLVEGLHQWGGPSRPSDDVARVIGFEDVENLHRQGDRLRAALGSGAALSSRDWQRSLVALEIGWASCYYGYAGEWEAMAVGWDDERTLRTLRRIQRALGGLRKPPRR